MFSSLPRLSSRQSSLPVFSSLLRLPSRLLRQCVFTPCRTRLLRSFNHPYKLQKSTTSSEAVGSVGVQLQELPRPVAMAEAHFTWGPNEVSSDEFIQSIKSAYAEVVQWKRNIFSVPSGKAGKSFVNELSWLFRSHADGSALESIALTAAMVCLHCCCKSLPQIKGMKVELFKVDCLKQSSLQQIRSLQPELLQS